MNCLRRPFIFRTTHGFRVPRVYTTVAQFSGPASSGVVLRSVLIPYNIIYNIYIRLSGLFAAATAQSRRKRGGGYQSNDIINSRPRPSVGVLPAKDVRCTDKTRYSWRFRRKIQLRRQSRMLSLGDCVMLWKIIVFVLHTPLQRRVQ